MATKFHSISLALAAAGGLLAPPPLAHAMDASMPTPADCQNMLVQMDELNAQAHRVRDSETAAMRASGQAAAAADKVRSLSAWDASVQRMKAEAELQRQQQIRQDEGDSSPFSARGAYVGKLQVMVAALRDAERSAQTAGLVDGGRNAMDDYAGRLRDRSIDLNHKAQDLEARARDVYLARQDCLARAQQARNDAPPPDDLMDVDVGRMFFPNTDRPPMGRDYPPPPPSQSGWNGGGERRARGQGDMPGWGKQNQGNGQGSDMPGWDKQAKRGKQGQDSSNDMPGWGKQKGGKKNRQN